MERKTEVENDSIKDPEEGPQDASQISIFFKRSSSWTRVAIPSFEAEAIIFKQIGLKIPKKFKSWIDVKKKTPVQSY